MLILILIWMLAGTALLRMLSALTQGDKAKGEAMQMLVQALQQSTQAPPAAQGTPPQPT